MGAEQGFGKRSRFEQCEAQQHRVAHASPNSPGNIAACGNALYQNGIDAYTHHNQKCLEAQGKQGAEVVLSGGAPIPIGHGGKRDRSNGGSQVHLDHAAINDQHDADGQSVHGQSHKEGLEP